MVIKVKCWCGSAYTFEDTPVDGRLQFPVTCVNCGADGTQKANDYIAAQLSGKPEPVPSKKGVLSFLKKKEDNTAADDEILAQPGKSIPDPIDDDKRKLVFAIVAALWAGAFGALGWLGMAKATGMEFGIAAWIIGAIVGLAVRNFGPRGHHLMGPIGGLAALLAIFGGELLTARWMINHQLTTFASQSYYEAVDWATEATEATNDTDLRSATTVYKLATLTVGDKHGGPLATYQHHQLTMSVFVVGHFIDRDQPIVVFAKQKEAEDEEKVTDAELAQFRTKVVPELKTLIAGKPSQAQYESTMKQMVNSRMTFGSLVLASMNHSLSWAWVIFGIITAFRVAQKV